MYDVFGVTFACLHGQNMYETPIRRDPMAMFMIALDRCVQYLCTRLNSMTTTLALRFPFLNPGRSRLLMLGFTRSQIFSTIGSCEEYAFLILKLDKEFFAASARKKTAERNSPGLISSNLIL